MLYRLEAFKPLAEFLQQFKDELWEELMDLDTTKVDPKIDTDRKRSILVEQLKIIGTIANLPAVVQEAKNQLDEYNKLAARAKNVVED